MKRLLFLLFAICFLHSFAAIVYTDKIEIMDGSLPHLVYSHNKGVNFAVDAYGSDGWKVTVHHERGWGYVTEGVVGSAAIAPCSFAETPMRHLAIGQACTNIPEYAFSQCQNLTAISFPINLEYIAENAFAGCSALKEVSLPYGTAVHSNAFHAAVKITRWGPETVADGLVQGLRTAEKGTLMRLVGMQRMKNASRIFSRPDNDDDRGLQPDDAVGICVKLGITPSAVYESPDGQFFTVNF